MANMIKNLSVYTTRANSNFHLREDLNFSDDGNYFRGFDYKGLPITTLRSGNETYCHVRVDYMKNKFAYREWMKTPEYKLADEFNGVSEIDLDKLIDNCEKILAKVAEMNERAENEVLDMTFVLARLEEEYDMVEKFIEEAKTSVKWWTLEPYQLKSLKESFDWEIKDLNRISDLIVAIETKTLEKERERYYYAFFNDCGYVVKKDMDGYGARKIKEVM